MRWMSLAIFCLVFFMFLSVLNATHLFNVAVSANTSVVTQQFQQVYNEKGQHPNYIMQIPVIGTVYQFFVNLVNVAKLLGSAFYNSTVGLPQFLSALGMPGALTGFISALVWIVYVLGLIEFLRGMKVV